jgi:excisionase family DNA binding protein
MEVKRSDEIKKINHSLPRVDEEQRLCISVPEAARMLGVSRNFCYDLVKQKQLPVIRFGKRILIPKIALEKLLEKGSTS